MFATKSELIEWLERHGFEQTDDESWHLPGRYVLAHGEYGRPDYAPRRYKGGWSLHATYYYFPGTLHAKEDGRVCNEFFTEEHA